MSTICHSLTAGGVPLFFMVSGYLLLGRKETTYKYVTHKIWVIVRYIAAACILYWAVMALIHWDYTQIKNCASEFVNTFMLRGPFTPFWFLWTMAVIYLLLPLIHRFYTRHTRAFAWAVALLGVFCILLFSAQFTGLRYSDRTLHQPLKMWKWLFFLRCGRSPQGLPGSSPALGLDCDMRRYSQRRTALLPRAGHQRHFQSRICRITGIATILPCHILLGRTAQMGRELRSAHQWRPVYAGIHDTLYYHSESHIVARPRLRLIHHLSAADMRALGGRFAYPSATARQRRHGAIFQAVNP